MKTNKWIAGLGILGLLVACGPAKSADTNSMVDQVSSTPAGSTVGDSYLESFSSHTGSGTDSGSEAPLDLAASEAMMLADQVNLASSEGGSDGPKVLLSTKVKVIQAGKPSSKVQLADGQTGWVPTADFAQGVRRAALKADGPAGWPQFTVVGYKPLADDPAQVEVFAAPTNGEAENRTTKLARKLLTFNTNDVNLIVLWRLAALETDPAAKTNLLNQALTRYSASSFAPMVQEKLDSISGKTVLATTAVSLIVSAVADNTKVWPEPEAGKGTPVATLSSGEQVQVVEQSEPRTVEGVSARWYKIADPVGWVFGADVKE